MRYRSGQLCVTAPITSDLPKVTHSPGQRGQCGHGDLSVVSQGTDLSLLVFYPSPLVLYPSPQCFTHSFWCFLNPIPSPGKHRAGAELPE